MIALASSFLQGERSFVIGAQTEAQRILLVRSDTQGRHADADAMIVPMATDQ